MGSTCIKQHLLCGAVRQEMSPTFPQFYRHLLGEKTCSKVIEADGSLLFQGEIHTKTSERFRLLEF